MSSDHPTTAVPPLDFCDAGEPPVLTFGLPEELNKLTRWAAKLGVSQPVFLLLDASRCDEEPIYIGTVLEYLRQTVPSESLSRWATERPFLHDLNQLLDACSVSPSVLKQYPPMPSTQRADRQLKDGLLSKLPLVALVARPVKCSTPAQSKWIEILRIWCFVQHLDAVQSGREVNEYLSTITRTLRQAIDSDEEWLSLYLRTEGRDGIGFFELTRHLSSVSQTLLGQHANGSLELRAVELQLLQRLRAFTNGKEPASASGAPQKYQGLYHHFFLAKPAAGRTTGLELPPNAVHFADVKELAPSEAIPLIFDTPFDEGLVNVVDVADFDLPIEQEHKAKGVLLATVEDHQFLPFSWNRVSPHEQTSLLSWIDAAWSAGTAAERHAALVAWLALQTAHSLRTALELKISTESADEWRIAPHNWELHRQPPRRYNGWQADEDGARWVAPRATRLSIPLPEPARRILTNLDLPSSTQGCSLAEALPEASELEHLFNDLGRQHPELERLRSGMLRQHLGQQVFSREQDATLSLLLASHPRSGLPGSCAYASYTIGNVQAALTMPNGTSDGSDHQPHAKPETPHESSDATLNGAGSELDPIESLLVQACARARGKVNSSGSSPSRWIEHHNSLTGYCVLALLAATGARPVTSVFESIEQFDLGDGLVYLDDKNSSAQHQGRLVPLPPEAVDLLVNTYLRHLERVAPLLTAQGSALGAQVAQLGKQGVEHPLPLFFFLGQQPSLHSVEISERTLSALELFDWPLPWNLMRHRLSTGLRRLGISSEVINGICGHAEQGTAAYGQFSTRSWSEDARAASGALSQLYRRLDLQPPEPPQWPEHEAVRVAIDESRETRSRAHLFGMRAREQRRRHEHARAREVAREEIERFINGRPVDSLSPEQWEKLGQQMLLTDNGLPHPLGSLRYQTFTEWLSEHWQEQGGRPRLRRRYLPALEEPSPFNGLAIHSARLLDLARSRLDQERSTPPSRLSLRQARWLGCAGLVLDGQIADETLLQDVAAGRNFRLVQLDQEAYLEHAHALARWPDAPVRRFWISHDCATWLLRSLRGENQLNLGETPAAPEWVQLLMPARATSAKPPHVADLLSLLCRHMQQHNAMHCPGDVAAYLSGDVVTAALAHPDWVRAARGFVPQATTHPVPAAVEAVEGNADERDDALLLQSQQTDPDFVMNVQALWRPALPPTSPGTVPPAGTGVKQPSDRIETGDLQTDREQQQRAARRFFRDIRAAIAEHSRKKSSPRRDLDAALRAIVARAQDVSPTCRLLGEWTRSLLWRSVRQRLLRLSSVERYLNALAVCFEAVAYDHDLATCDAEDLTDFYGQILDSRRLARQSASSRAEDDESADREDAGQNQQQYRTWKLAASLLRDFHRTCSRELALEDPDWAEFLVADMPLSISPGLILEQDYLHMLRLLVGGDVNTASHRALSKALVLLLCMRFGLRGQEATGLMRDDWVTPEDGSIVVLVRNNAQRKLKTLAGRRQVPLLFELQALETALIERFLALWLGISGGDRKVPLFADPRKVNEPMDEKVIRAELSKLIKQVTRHDNLSLHHARHTFANLVACHLLDGTHDIWPFARAQALTAQRRSHVRRLLLCTDGTTRRTLWALARLLGHAHPQSSVRSYLHLQPERAAQVVRAGRPDAAIRRPLVHEKLIDLDACLPVEGYLAGHEVLQEQEEPSISALAMLRFLYLYQNGSTPAAAAFATALPETFAERLVQAIAQVDTTLAARDPVNPHMGGSSRLLSHIAPTRWKHWNDRSAAWTLGSLAPVTDKDFPLEQWLQRITPNRQLVLFQEEHFAHWRQVANGLGLTDLDFSVIGTRDLHADVQAWAQHHGFEVKAADTVAEDGRRIQIDTATAGHPPMSVRHRCAVLARTEEHSALASSFELLLLYTVATVFLYGQTPSTPSGQAQINQQPVSA